LPHLAKVQELSSLAIVKAESLFAEGKVKEGTAWLLVAHRMARHAGTGDLLISNLVQESLEANALHAAARHCLGWDADTRQAYLTALRDLPPLHPLENAFRGERMFINWMERHFVTAGQADPQTQALLANLVNISGKDEQPDRAALLAQLTPEAMKATLSEWRNLQSRLETAAGKPWSQSQPEFKAVLEEESHSPHLLLRSAMPVTAGVAERWHIVSTLRTMLEAALQHGPELNATIAATYRDSLDGEPLQIKTEANGALTLSTARQHPAGKDLSLQLGK